MRRSAGLAIAAAGAALAGAAVATALDGESETALAEAREFREFRLFYLGERFRSKDLTHVSREPDRRGYTRFAFIYGDCTPGPDSGCAPPYQLHNFSACSRNRPSRGGLSPKRRKPIRGAAVYEFSDGGSFDALEVFTGRTTVVVYAPTAAKARRVVRKLESPNVDLGPDDPLGPPARGAANGKLRCPPPS